MTNNNYPCVLTIAGTDPSGGAGIQADIKAISATGSYAASVITALVAQNTQGVLAIEEISPAFVTQQLDSVFSDLTIRAVKIGMLHNEKIIDVIAAGLEKYKPQNIVLDPVMVAKNGCDLLLPEVVSFLKSRLFPLIHLLTPNLFEAEKILATDINNCSAMEAAAKAIGSEYNINVLLKGGHLNTEQSSDVLYAKDTQTLSWFHADRIETKNTHGTGCTLSAAIASYLAQGYPLEKAISTAKKYLSDAILSGSTLQIGKGRGPVNHFYFLQGLKNDR